MDARIPMSAALAVLSVSFAVSVGDNLSAACIGVTTPTSYVSAAESRDTSDSCHSKIDPYPFHHLVTLGAIRAYQLLIRPSKGSICPMHPHCSLYGYQAFQRHNPLKAFLMTADRLHRCGHDLDNYPPVEVAGAVRFFDPVDACPIHDRPHSDSGPESKTDVQIPILAVGDTLYSSADTQDGEILEDARLFHFAKMLQTEGDYERAITEYRRLVVYFPSSRYWARASRSVFDCYYKAGQYLEAIHWGQDLLGASTDLEDRDGLRFFIGASYFRLRNYRVARTHFAKLTEGACGVVRERSLMLQGLAYARDEMWKNAQESFAAVPHESGLSSRARECERISRLGAQLRPKSALTTGFLALVPGLGYLYAGYRQTALAAFIVNSLFIAATVEAFDQDNDGLGSILGVLSFGWYSGSIYGSVLSAHRRNFKSQEDLLSKFDVGFQY